jgi:hypothetical protein
VLNIKEIMEVTGNPDIIDIIEKKRLQQYGHVKRVPEERIPKLILEWVPAERRIEDVLEKHGWKECTQP